MKNEVALHQKIKICQNLSNCTSALMVVFPPKLSFIQFLHSFTHFSVHRKNENWFSLNVIGSVWSWWIVRRIVANTQASRKFNSESERAKQHTHSEYIASSLMLCVCMRTYYYIHRVHVMYRTVSLVSHSSESCLFSNWFGLSNRSACMCTVCALLLSCEWSVWLCVCGCALCYPIPNTHSYS